MGSGGATGGSTTGGGAGTGTGGSIGVGGSISVTGGSAGMDQVDPDTACGMGEANANLKPVNMLVMFDRSGSMLDCSDGTDRSNQELCPSGPSRWDTASAALKAFFADPGADGLGVALRFFPHDLPAAGCQGGNQGACDANACAQPLVDMGTLMVDPAPTDAQEAALVSAVDASGPDMPGMQGGNQGGGTPIMAALDGALTWASAYQMANPDQRTVVVFVTDGAPNGCGNNFGQIAQLAADALANAGVSTYMIGLLDTNGMGVNQQDMDRVAAAGGTMQAFYVSDGQQATQQLIDAFNAIRGSAIRCDFDVPTSTSSGALINPKLINVNYTPGGGTEVQLGLVDGPDACADKQAWYYDDPANPTQILLCPAACDTVTADEGAQITILAGCQPRPVP